MLQLPEDILLKVARAGLRCGFLLAAFLWLGQAGADVVPAARVKVELETRLIQGESLEGALLLRPLSPSGESRSIEIKGVREVTLSLPAGSVWEVKPDIRRYWAPVTRIEVRGPDELTNYILGLWPKASLAGTVAVDKGERLPAKLGVKLRGSRAGGRKPEIPELTVECPVAPQGDWRCEVPAALADLSVLVDGFVPNHRWEVRLDRDKTLNLGRLALKRGASVSGWVEAEEGALDFLQAKARLVPMIAPGGDSNLSERLAASALEARLDARGRFQFVGVDPGSYSLEVTQPGFSPAQVSPIEVWPASETSLTRPLVLRRPVRFEIAVTPEKDWLGKPWRVEVTRAADLGGLGTLVYDGTLSSSGRHVLPGQSPGILRVVVFDSLGNPLYSDFEVPVASGSDQRLDIEIDLVTVEGKVLLGEEPLSATLYFGGRNARLGTKMDSNEEGVFHGVLPREGNWFVDVEAAEPGLAIPARVEVQARPNGEARVTIELPDTKVFGKVVDEENRPVVARVLVSGGQGEAEVSSAEDGSFTVRGVEPGAARLSAAARSKAGSRVSETLLIAIQEGQPAGPFELRLRKNKVVAGRVLAPRGPVSGAAIEVFPWRPLLPGGSSARSDLQGGFEVHVPEPTQAVLAIVSPPGNSLRAFEVPLDGQPFLLEVSQEGGTLDILLEGADDESLAQGLQVVVFQNGLRVPWDAMLRWARGHGASLRSAEGFQIPSVGTGEYRVCIVPQAELIERASEGASGLQGRCAAGYLESGGNLRLDLRRR